MRFRAQALPTRGQALARCALAVLAALVCAGTLSAALLVPAPVPVLPLLLVVCIGYPMLTATELPTCLAVLGATRPSRSALDGRHVRNLLLELEQLPETRHPLGL